MRFIADSTPSEARTREIAALAPHNAFATTAYASARQRLGEGCWLLAVSSSKGLGSACFGFLRRGRVNRSLEIPSLPTLRDGSVFFEGLRQFCRDQRITVVDLNSYGSESVSIPNFPRESNRRARVEWVIDLTHDWQSRLSMNHRRNISRSRKLGVSVRRSNDANAQSAHSELIRAAVARRERGTDEKTISSRVARPLVQALMEAGAGDCFQAVLADRVLSSTLILNAEKGAYYHSAATSDEGREAGASPFLIQAIAERLRADGRDSLNLGDAGPDNPGLQRFKAGFGARAVPLTAVRAQPFSIRTSPIAAALYFGRQFLAGLR